MVGPILTVAETGSTNADLLAMAREGSAVDGMWLRAVRQSAGRGRQSRAWQSPPGNLYASTLVQLHAGDPPAPTLALVAAVALADAVERAGCPSVRIKWPNDLLLRGAKVAGILLEREGDWVVAGIGVNLAHAPDVAGRATAAVGEVLSTDVQTFHGLLIDTTAEWLATWRNSGVSAIIQPWLARAHERGTPLRVTLPDGEEINGGFDGLAPDGALMLRLADGAARVIHAGDVFLI